MRTIQKHVSAFIKLGQFLSQFSRNNIKKSTTVEFNELFFEGFKLQLKISEENNSWYTKENLLFSIENWANALTESNLKEWTSTIQETNNPKKVAIIMAGNIPLVGFHDFLSVLVSGHAVLVKQSSNDKHLLPYLAKYLEYVEPDLKGSILFTEDKLTNFDAVIATGSNNTARYFEHYFKEKPNIIRKNRNSVAVITGNETEDELINLSNDIFQYFGLGCRSVSKIFVPKNYQFDAFFGGMYNKKHFINNAKYANNYDYNKAVYLMSEFDILENGFLMIKEDLSYSSPIATVFYEYYEDLKTLKLKLDLESESIQCVVGNGFSENEIKYGQTQYPQLWDYADNINTLEFLAKI